MLARLRGSVRGAVRLIALGGVVAISAAAITVGPSNRASLGARARWLQRTCRAALRALGIRWLPVGAVPTPGKIVTANHLGYLDILVLAAMAPCVFVAKREVRGWPIFGWFARMAGTRFLDREKRGDVARVADELAPAIAAGVNVVLFLEGTSTDGREVRAFRSSLLEPAAAAAWPVVPAAISYGVPVGHSAEDEVCWWGDMTLAPHLWNLATIARVQAYVAWGAPAIAVADRKVLARVLRDRVAAMHVALRGCAAEIPHASAMSSVRQSEPVAAS